MTVSTQRCGTQVGTLEYFAGLGALPVLRHAFTSISPETENSIPNGSMYLPVALACMTPGGCGPVWPTKSAVLASWIELKVRACGPSILATKKSQPPKLGLRFAAAWSAAWRGAMGGTMPTPHW